MAKAHSLLEGVRYPKQRSVVQALAREAARLMLVEGVEPRRKNQREDHEQDDGLPAANLTFGLAS